jgi:hypothetical protein
VAGCNPAAGSHLYIDQTGEASLGFCLSLSAANCNTNRVAVNK